MFKKKKKKNLPKDPIQTLRFLYAHQLPIGFPPILDIRF